MYISSILVDLPDTLENGGEYLSRLDLKLCVDVESDPLIKGTDERTIKVKVRYRENQLDANTLMREYLFVVV